MTIRHFEPRTARAAAASCWPCAALAAGCQVGRTPRARSHRAARGRRRRADPASRRAREADCAREVAGAADRRTSRRRATRCRTTPRASPRRCARRCSSPATTSTSRPRTSATSPRPYAERAKVGKPVVDRAKKTVEHHAAERRGPHGGLHRQPGLRHAARGQRQRSSFTPKPVKPNLPSGRRAGLADGRPPADRRRCRRASTRQDQAGGRRRVLMPEAETTAFVVT